MPIDQLKPWAEILVYLVVGFLLGLLTNIKTGGGSRYFTVAIAQIPYRFQEFRVPLLPRCVFVSLLLALLPLSTGEFQDPLFATCVVLLVISVGAWLFVASQHLAEDERRRKAEIERFLADANESVPAPSQMPEKLSRRLQVWSKVNNLMFLLLTIRAVMPVLLFILWNHRFVAS
jgi:hypothetical protein